MQEHFHRNRNDVCMLLRSMHHPSQHESAHYSLDKFKNECKQPTIMIIILESEEFHELTEPPVLYELKKATRIPWIHAIYENNCFTSSQNLQALEKVVYRLKTMHIERKSSGDTPQQQDMIHICNRILRCKCAYDFIFTSLWLLRQIVNSDASGCQLG